MKGLCFSLQESLFSKELSVKMNGEDGEAASPLQRRTGWERAIRGSCWKELRVHKAHMMRRVQERMDWWRVKVKIINKEKGTKAACEWTNWKRGERIDRERSQWMQEKEREKGVDEKKSQEDSRNPERICQLLLALILMEARALLPLTHLALIPALLSKLFKL